MSSVEKGCASRVIYLPILWVFERKLTKLSIKYVKSSSAGGTVLLAVSPLTENVIPIIFGFCAAPQNPSIVLSSALVVLGVAVSEGEHTDLIIDCVAARLGLGFIELPVSDRVFSTVVHRAKVPGIPLVSPVQRGRQVRWVSSFTFQHFLDWAPSLARSGTSLSNTLTVLGAVVKKGEDTGTRVSEAVNWSFHMISNRTSFVL